jgi:hypothetical protein
MHKKTRIKNWGNDKWVKMYQQEGMWGVGKNRAVSQYGTLTFWWRRALSR